MIQMSIKERLEDVERRITEAAQKSGRKREDITLVAVTKTHPVDMMNEAIKLGVTDIGENRPQAVRDKFNDVLPVKWHLIGQLQTNKVKYIIDKVCLIHSVDSIKLMDEIERQAIKHDLVMDILIEVNISGEESKSGVSKNEVWNLLEYAGKLTHVKVKGLMTVAPKTDNSVTNTLHFDNIRQLFLDIKQKKYDNVNMLYLSMGMSGDFETAIECGSNMVRVGSAIFGARDYSQN